MQKFLLFVYNVDKCSGDGTRVVRFGNKFFFSHGALCWLGFVSLKHGRVILEEGIAVEKRPTPHFSVVLINDRGKKVHPVEGIATCWQLVLDAVIQ